MNAWSVFPAVCLFVLPLAAAETPWSMKTVAGCDLAGDGGPAVFAPLGQTGGIAVDARGNIYVSDSADHRVRRIGANGVIETVAGDGHAGLRGDGGPANRAQLRAPYGLALDARGNLYIADFGNARVRVVSPDGLIRTVAGGGVLEPTRGRAAVDVRLQAPRNVAVDAAGSLFISDFAAHRVYRVAPSGELEFVAGAGAPGYSGDGSLATLAQLRSPAGLAIEPGGALYVADSGNRAVRRIARGVIESVGVAGMPAFVFPLPIYAPTGLALDPAGNLYIADGVQLLRMPPLGKPTLLPGTGSDIAVDTAGVVYTASGALVQRIAGAFGAAIAGSGAYGFGGEGGPALAARFRQPSAIAAGGDGAIYIADERNHRIRKVTASGAVVTIAGTGLRGKLGDFGFALGTRIDSPAGIAVDAAGNVFFSDTGNHRIRKITPDGQISTVAGSGAKGFFGDGGAALFASFDTPTGLWLDPAGNLLIADTANSRIRLLSPYGQISTIAGDGTPAQLDRPRGIAMDAEGNLYVADTGNNRIRKWSANGAVSTVMEGLNAPCGVLVDAGGAIYAADTGFHRIRKVARAGGEATTIAGTAEEGFNGEEGAALAMQLSFPTGLALLPDGGLLFSDTVNNRVRKLYSAPPPDAIMEPLRDVRITHAATGSAGPFAPGQLIVVDGLPSVENLAAAIDGQALRVHSSAENRLVLQLPYELAGRAAATLCFGVFERELALVDAAPGFFQPERGTASAARGAVLALLATGEGASRLPVSVMIGGAAAEVVALAGDGGLLQLQVRIPQGAPSGDAPVVLRVGSIASPPDVRIVVE